MVQFKSSDTRTTWGFKNTLAELVNGLCTMALALMLSIYPVLLFLFFVTGLLTLSFFLGLSAIVLIETL